MKLTNNQKQGIASRVQKKYDYMDKLPMQGWSWEFLRRNEQYIEAFSKLEALVKRDVWNDECNKRLSELRRLALPAGFHIGRMSLKLKKPVRGFLSLKLPPHKGDYAPSNKYFGSEHHTCIVPRPEKRYCDIIGSLFFRYQIPDYRIYKSFDVLLNEQMTVTLSPDGKNIIAKPSADRSNDVFYVAVSKKVNISDLKEYMLADIAIILSKHNKNKPKIRKDKWKYYLIVYDLKQQSNDEITYDKICDILRESYPEKEEEKFDSAKNIENWYEHATSLINGGYIKYLKPTIPPTK